MAKGEQLNNVSARLTDDEYNKALAIQEKYSNMTKKKYSLADILRIGIEHLHSEEMKLGDRMTIFIKQQLEEMQAYQQQLNSNNTTQIGLSDSNESNRKTESKATTHLETSENATQDIDRQLKEYMDSLMAENNPQTNKPYTQAQIKKLLDAKRKELTQ